MNNIFGLKKEIFELEKQINGYGLYKLEQQQC